jgi:hypothetical protein
VRVRVRVPVRVRCGGGLRGAFDHGGPTVTAQTRPLRDTRADPPAKFAG